MKIGPFNVIIHGATDLSCRWKILAFGWVFNGRRHAVQLFRWGYEKCDPELWIKVYEKE